MPNSCALSSQLSTVMLGKRASFAGSGVRCRHKDPAAETARRSTMQCIAFDSHEHYTWALVQDEAGNVLSCSPPEA